MYALNRTTSALEDIKSHISGLEHPDEEIVHFLTQHLTVIFYAEMEEKVKNIYIERISKNADEKMYYFARNSSDRWYRLVKVREVKDLAKCFGPECHAALNSALDQREATIYSNVITNRHKTSHGAGGNITINEVENALKAASKILRELDAAIR